jgi:MFS family permease
MFHASFDGVFINTLLYRVSGGEMSIVIIYRGMVYFSTAVFFYLAAYVSQKKSPVFTVRLGVSSMLLTYALLFVFIDYAPELKYLIAVLNGFAGGFYWSGHATLIPHYTTKDNRDIAIAVTGIIGGVMALFVPVLSGFVIMFMPEISGYRVMFGVCMLSVLIQLYFISKFHPVEQKHNESQIKLAIRLCIRKLTFRLMLSYEFIKGLREGVFMFMLNMLLFDIVTNESIVGINTFFTGFMAITGSWVYGKAVCQSRRVKYSFLGVLMPFLICLILLWRMDMVTMMIFTATNSFLQLFFLYSYANTTFDVVAQNKLTRKASAESLAIRETAMMFGRVLGLVLTMWLATYGQRGYVVVLLSLTFTQFIAVWLMKKTLWCFGRKNHDQT